MAALPSTLRLVLSFAAVGELPLVTGSGGDSSVAPLPFPPLARMNDRQRTAMAQLRKTAEEASAAATPRLLEVLGSDKFRNSLHRCCARSGIASWSPQRLLAHLRSNLYASELVHNFDGSGHAGLTLDIALYNATEYFPNSWQLLHLGYLGNDTFNPKFGHPASPSDGSEEGIFKLQPFRGAHDLPGDYGEASSRLQYVALNMLRVDAGNPMFGDVAAIFSPSLWRDAIAAAGIDSGIYTLCCNQTYLQTPGSVHVPCERIAPTLLCHAGEPTPGVSGAMDHALLNNHLMWGAEDSLVKVLSRWHGDSDVNVTLLESTFFIEANILGNALYAERDMKMLVGSFGPLFGTVRGKLLREYAARQHIALAWALGPALTNVSKGDPFISAASFHPQARLLDAMGPTTDLVNVTVPSSTEAALAMVWDEAGRARDSLGQMPQGRVLELWEAAKRAVPRGMHLQLPAAGDCTDWHGCLGLSGLGACVCYKGGQESLVV